MKNMLDTFCINKSRTTAYHPQCDGMVERFNRSLLQLLRAYVEKESDWERYLSMALFAYRTAVHSSTGVSPFMLMFGRSPKITPVIDKAIAFDTGTYFHQLRVKFSGLQDFVHEKLKNEAFHQQEAYDKTYKARGRKFKIGEAVWLSIPTAGKLQSRWEGMWIVKAIKSEVNLEISDGVRTKVVHVNRIRHRLQVMMHLLQMTVRVTIPGFLHRSIISLMKLEFRITLARNDDTLNAQETCLSVMGHIYVMLVDVDKLNLERAYVATLHILLRMHIT